jgi:hypothetical protein
MGDARAVLADACRAAGVAATTDPGAVPPMVLVDAGTYREPAGLGGWAVVIPVRVVAPAPGDAAALAWLEDTVEAVLAVAGWASAEPGTWAPSPVVAALPAYTLAYARTIPNPNC